MNKIGQYLSGIALLLLSLFIWDACTVRKTIDSPAETLGAELRVRGGVPYMDVFTGAGQKLLTVRLGMNTSEGNFEKRVKIEGQVRAETLDNTYTLTNGKRSHVDLHQSTAVYKLVNADGYRMQVELRLGEDGLAFRYRIPGKRNISVTHDFTTYYFPQEAVGFLQPMQPEAKAEGEGNFNYETLPAIEVPLSTRSAERMGWCYPALVKSEVGGHTRWTLVSETGVRGYYCATHLADADSLGGLKIAYPVDPDTRAPLYPTFSNSTPWRVLVLADTLATIVENTWMTDLTTPEIDPTQAYRPGRAAWSWLARRDAAMTVDEQRRYIDMAARLGFEYCLIDEHWENLLGEEAVCELVDYARARQVALWLRYDSEAIATPEKRQAVLARLQQWGVYGLKVNFSSGDEQASMQLYEALLREANDYGLAVALHGTTMPRGWERAFPNLLTSEAVMGMQHALTSRDYEASRARHIAHLVFTRNVAGPMDFTPVVLDRQVGVDPVSGPIGRSTTAAFELALPVLLQSGMQSYGLTPAQVEAYPEFVADYFAAVPATWDETRFVDGYPGRYVVLARRAGTRWWIAAVNACDEPLDVTVDATFTGHEWLYRLQAEEADSLRQERVATDRPLHFRLAPRDGVVWYSSAE